MVDLSREAGRRAGYAPEKLRVGMHASGFVGDTTRQAADAFYRGYARLVGVLGKERGWPAPNRAQFDASISPAGPFMIGDPEAVIQELLCADQALGGLNRVTFQMTNILMPHESMLHAITLLGTEVIPKLNERPCAQRA